MSLFGITQRGSTAWREVFGGVTTFMAMSYIIFVQVGLLGSDGVGMDPGGVMMATCLAAAVGSIVMGLLANYPIGQAPGMGQNFFFAFSLAGAMGAWSLGVAGWKMALAMVVLTGVAFLVLSLVGFRSYVLNAIPVSLRYGIAGGIGLFVALLGLDLGNLITATGGLVGFAGFVSTTADGQTVLNSAALLTLLGLGVVLVLSALKVPGAVLWAILVNTAAALLVGMLHWGGQILSVPSGLGKTAGGFIEGFGGLWSAVTSHHLLEVLVLAFVLLFMDLFDTVGTLVGVANRAGLMEGDRLPRAERALAADATASIASGLLGTSTVTSYIESATGVEVGARTGLAAVVTGVLFVAAMFFQPLIQLIGGGVQIAPGVFKNPMVAPAMIFVGAMMIRALNQIDWDDVTEFFPAVLAAIVMPLTMNISHGIAIGFVSYAVGKLFTGRLRQCPLMVYIVAVFFVLRYLLWALLEAGVFGGGG